MGRATPPRAHLEVNAPDRVELAEASADDLPAVLPLHEAAFAGTMGVALGRPYLRRFLRSFVDDPARTFLVARLRGQPVGYVFGRPVDQASGDDRALLPYAAAGVLRHPGLVLRPDIRAEAWRRVRSIGRPAPPSPELPAPTRSLVGIGTSPGHRGLGIGAQLVRAFMERAVADGFASTRLSVYRDNPAARRLYERCGWTPFDHPTNPTVLYYAWVPGG